MLWCTQENRTESGEENREGIRRVVEGRASGRRGSDGERVKIGTHTWRSGVEPGTSG